MQYKPRLVFYYSCSPNIKLVVSISLEPECGRVDKLSQKLENAVLHVPTGRILIYAKAGHTSCVLIGLDIDP